MALPQELLAGLLPTEAEYLSTSNVEINIVPLIRIDRVRLLDGIYGPLQPPKQAKVPLWMALTLKRRKKCSIVCPIWMQAENLKKTLLFETTNEEFAQLPLHYMAISKLLIENSADDIPDGDDVRSYLKSIRETRQSKILSGIEAINTEHLTMTNISLGEICEIRGVFSTAFQQLRAIQKSGEQDQLTEQTQRSEFYTEDFGEVDHLRPDPRHIQYSLEINDENGKRQDHSFNGVSSTLNTPMNVNRISRSRFESQDGEEASAQDDSMAATGENNMDLF